MDSWSGDACDSAGVEVLYSNVTSALSAAGISASVGKAVCDPRFGFAHAVAEANKAMYDAKKARRAAIRRTGSAA